jgi:hypothetical protein
MTPISAVNTGRATCALQPKGEMPASTSSPESTWEIERILQCSVLRDLQLIEQTRLNSGSPAIQPVQELQGLLTQRAVPIDGSHRTTYVEETNLDVRRLTHRTRASLEFARIRAYHNRRTALKKPQD